MDHDDFRTILESSEVDIWTFMDTAIAVASADYGTELKHRRDGIVERLYATTSVPPQCPNCDADGPNGHNGNQPKAVSPYTPQSVGGDGSEEDEEELDPYAGLFDDEQKKILDIKKQLEDPYQSEETLVELLQTLADMEISVQELKEADIGKHVSQLRKQHPSDVVRRLAKQIVNKWKGIVNEWVKLHGEQQSSSTMVDEDSPQQKIPHNGLHQVPDFAYSPNPHNGSSGANSNSRKASINPKALLLLLLLRSCVCSPSKLVPHSFTAPLPLFIISSPTSSAYQLREREMAKENSCLTRVATGAVIGGAIGGAVGSVYGTYEALRFKVPGFLKIRHIGQRTVSSAALFGLFLGAGSLIHCGKSY